MKNSNRLALVGIVLMLPATILVSGGVLEFTVPQTIVSPALVLGGMLGAFLLNLYAILRIRTEREESGGIAAVTVRIGAKFGNLAVVGICALLFTAISTYLLVENFRPRETPYWSDLIR